ncbi:alpha-N-acetyl-neuraminyl-2,3-beta-galactosyl-1,3-N-acetyl-galactosaminide alpha-2,6-sialyltransferase-like isoform X3 [Diadema antillarum]|uniref:alpha-N-acetyl-neuraminyl-2,3-beta-galactosyl-1, 3-N-acetyl-galactosaminide alpha-2,6-sialyltransferase-like isoform X3 n=1 Tax=Diadema antillarum TaxID=105358 RepID=UPI003A8BD877
MEGCLRTIPSWKLVPLVVIVFCFCVSTSLYYTESWTVTSRQVIVSGHRRRPQEAPAATPGPLGNSSCIHSNSTVAGGGAASEIGQCAQSDERTKTESTVRSKEAVDTFVFSRGSMSKNDTAAQTVKEKNASVMLSQNNGDVVVEDIPAASPETEKAASRALASSAMKDLSGYISVLNRKVLDLHCTSCAYVSSSGQLFGANAGSTIDSYPCVIRMNNAPTEGFEEDVGSKTTVRVVAHSALPGVIKGKAKVLAGKGQPKYMVVWGPYLKMRTDGKGGTYNAAASLARQKEPDGMKVFMLTGGQIDIADNIFEKETNRNRMASGSWLSTGWFTMLLARAMCDDIHVFGMVNDSYCQSHPNSKVPYHYFQGKGGLQECSYYQANEKGKRFSHRFVTEKTVFARWAAQGMPSITFHVPEWTPAPQ